MTTLYIVMDSRNEYGDNVEWLVAAYRSELLAKEHVLKVSAALRAFQALDSDARAELAGGWGKSMPTALDPKGFYTFENNERYWVDSVELLEDVP
jgi:hypothetical protein